MAGGELEYVVCNLCGSDDAEPFLQLDRWKVVRCRRCGLAYVNPRPSREVIKEQYQEKVAHRGVWAAEYLEFYKQRIVLDEHKFAEYLAKIERYKEPGRILDVGCATGAFLSVAKRRGWEAYGVEIGEWAADFARACGLDVFIGTLEEARFPDRYFDVVFSKSLLEHLPDPRGSLVEMRRILKDDGLLVVAGVPNVDSVTIRLGLDLFSGNKPPAHLYYFNPRTLRDMVQRCGFDCIQLLSWGIPNDFFKGILGRNRVGEGFDQVCDCLTTRYGKGGPLGRVIYRSIRSAVNSLLNIFKVGAIVEVYAFKRQDQGG